MQKSESDGYKQQGLRRKMVAALQKKGVDDARVLAAMAAVPRHLFVDKTFEEHAYEDKPFSIGCQQTISQPFTVAYQTSLLQVAPREKVLEIGTGSGYQAAVLAELGARVFTLERYEALHRQAVARLEALGYGRIRCYLRDGFKGLPEMAPFDKILVTCGAPAPPEALKSQLAPGGIMVIPVGEGVQQMVLLRRIGPDEYSETRLDIFRFVPFLEGVVRETKA